MGAMREKARLTSPCSLKWGCEKPATAFASKNGDQWVRGCRKQGQLNPLLHPLLHPLRTLAQPLALAPPCSMVFSALLPPCCGFRGLWWEVVCLWQRFFVQMVVWRKAAHHFGVGIKARPMGTRTKEASKARPSPSPCSTQPLAGGPVLVGGVVGSEVCLRLEFFALVVMGEKPATASPCSFPLALPPYI
jgi:hypothetical protein